MKKKKQTGYQDLKKIAKHALPALYWEEMIGKKEISNDDLRKWHKEQGNDTSWINDDDKHEIPVYTKKDISWNIHFRELQRNFKKYGELGVKAYIQEVKDLHLQYLVKFPHYYHLSDWIKYENVSEKADDKLRNKLLIKAIDSTLTHNIIKVFTNS